MKKLTSLMLAVLVLLSGCSQQAGSITTKAATTSTGENVVEKSDIISLEDIGLTFQKELLSEKSDIKNMYVSENEVYLATDYEIYHVNGNNTELIYSSETSIQCFAVDAENTYLVSGQAYRTEDGIYQEDYAFVTVKGSSETSTPLSNIDGYIGGGAMQIVTTKTGPYINCVDCIISFDTSGQFLKSYQSDTLHIIDMIATDVESNVYAASSGANFSVYRIGSEVFTQCISLGNGNLTNGIMINGDDSTTLLFADSRGLYSYNGSTITMVAAWANSGISFYSIDAMYTYGTDSYIVLDSGKVYILRPVSADSVAASTVITIAVDSPDDILQEAVSQFNATNGTYSVEIAQYSNGNDGYTEGLERLNLELISGEGPDIIAYDNINISKIYEFGYHGFLVDLNTLMDQDSAFTRDDVPILRVLENNDKLYYVANGFRIHTSLGLTSTFGNKTGWTYDEYMDMEQKNNGTVYRYMAPAMFLSYSIFTLEHQLIDFTTNECYFDGEDFKKILSIASSQENTMQLRSQDDEAGISDEFYFLSTGEAIACNATLGSYLEFAFLESQVGTELALIGWPDLDGSCGSSYVLNTMYAINANSNNVNGAWEFIKFLLTDSNIQKLISESEWFPVSTSVRQAVAHASMDETILNEWKYPSTTQEQIDKVDTIIAQITSIYSQDSDIYGIIEEECQAFFEGDKTVEETASIIQNRIQIYLGEHK